MTPHIKTIGIYLILIIFQAKGSYLFEINGIRPNVLLIYLFFDSINNENVKRGLIMGFFSGLFYEAN